MHELALSQSIIDMVSERAALEGLRSVSRVVIEVGQAAGVESEALRFCFDVLAAETMTEGAELVILPVALRARCRSCMCDFAPLSLISACPECGGFDRDVFAGRELRVKSIEGE